VPPQHVLLIGDYEHPDFAGLEHWLRSRADVTCVADVASAVRSAASADLCLFVEARPGRIRQDEVEAIHRRAPLARLAVIAGAWCEGEMRTGAPPSGVLRMYWHEWLARLGALWSSTAGREAASWSLPRTSLAGERTLASAPRCGEDRPQLIAIRAENAASYGALAAAMQAAGHAAVWISSSQPARVRGAAALLWEGNVRSDAEVAELSRLARAVHPAPTLALLNFPRVTDRRLALAAGACDILAKPFMLTDLFQSLQDAPAPSDREKPSGTVDPCAH
jgi:hypothetical protein